MESLYRTALATKELVETLAGQRGQAYDVAVTWEDLLDLQLIRKADIPYDIGSHPLQRSPMHGEAIAKLAGTDFNPRT